MWLRKQKYAIRINNLFHKFTDVTLKNLNNIESSIVEYER